MSLALARSFVRLHSRCACVISSSVFPTVRPVSHPLPVQATYHRIPHWSLRGSRLASSNVQLLDQVNTELGSLEQSKTFCVVHIGGRQFKVTGNDLIVVNRLQADVGAEIFLEKVLLAGTENCTLVGQPILSDDVVRVRATVVEHNKTAKVIVFKKKRRKNYKRKIGHRQPVTVLRINNIQLNTLQH